MPTFSASASRSVISVFNLFIPSSGKWGAAASPAGATAATSGIVFGLGDGDIVLDFVDFFSSGRKYVATALILISAYPSFFLTFFSFPFSLGLASATSGSVVRYERVGELGCDVDLDVV